jgi:2-polyprenyl-3-methyl-5-hydroxy-6-metoxy-1,4-benzoquinol methylase
VSPSNHDYQVVDLCPLCGSSDHQLFRGYEVTNRICQKCGLVFQSPRLSEDGLDQYYRQEYISQHQGYQGVSEKELRVQAGRARHLVSVLRCNNISVHLHLDIGSSTGALLQAVKRAFQCRSVGIELADVYRAYSADHGIEVYPTLEAMSTAYNQPFDLITMVHVLEHLADPVGFLSELRENWLTADGAILVEVPNLFGHACFELPHLTSLHQGTLRIVLTQAGYRLDWIRIHGRPRSMILPLYITALARCAEIDDRPEPVHLHPATVRFQRSLSMLKVQFANRFLTRWAWLPLPELDPEMDPSTTAEVQS